MDMNNQAVNDFFRYANKLIKELAVSLVKNVNPTWDDKEYSYNTVVRMQIANLKALKKCFINDMKEKVIASKNNGAKDTEVQTLWAQVEKFVKENKDILDDEEILNIPWNR